MERWKIKKAIFYNFWYYGYQEFELKDGSAILRGLNGSGKSVTTQTLITVLLDGDTRPFRLDPFGSKNRTLKDTLLGEKGMLPIEQRIGYVVLEFQKGTTGITKTIGMGVEASRQKNGTNTWYFILDGTGIGKKENQFRLFEEEVINGKKVEIPHNEKKFKRKVEEQACGKVFNKQSDYAEKVNKTLFGFDTKEGYEGLINLLLQLRSPQLSDQSKPEGVAEVLNNSLPQLSNEELRPLTTTIEAIDEIQKKLQMSKKDISLLESLTDAYDHYHKHVLVEKANEFIRTKSEFENLKKQVLKNEQEKKQKEERTLHIHQELMQVTNQKEAYEEELSTLQQNKEINEIQDQKNNQLAIQADMERKIQSVDEKIQTTKQKSHTWKKEKEAMDLSIHQLTKKIDQELQELTLLGEEIYFEQSEQWLHHFKETHKDTSYSFYSWRKSVEEYEQFLKDTKKELDKYESWIAKKKSLAADVADIQSNIEETKKESQYKMKQYEEQEAQYVEQLHQWASTLQQLQMTKEDMDEVLKKLAHLFQNVDIETFQSVVKRKYEQKQNTLKEKEIQLTYEAKEVKTETKKTFNEWTEWKNKTEVEPDFTANKQLAWQTLKQKNINFLPFYEMCEFKEHLSAEEQVNLQNALVESGIFSSVIVSKKEVESAKKHSAVLSFKEKKKENLTTYLTVVPSSLEKEAQEVLEGISVVQTGDSFVLKEGNLQTSFTGGKASEYSETIFIGKAAREQYRKQKEQELETAYITLLQKEDVLKQRIKTNKDKQEQLVSEYHSFPSLNALKQKWTEYQTKTNLISSVYEPALEKKMEEEEAAKQSSKELLAKIKATIEWSELPLSTEAYNQALDGAGEYKTALMNAEIHSKELTSARKNAENFRIWMEEMEDSLMEWESDKRDYEIQKDKAKQLIASCEEMLKHLGSETIQERMAELKLFIGTTFSEKTGQLQVEQGQLGGEIRQLDIRIGQERQVEMPYKKMMVDIWEKVFAEHLELPVFTEELENGIDWQGVSAEEKAERVMKKNQDLLHKDRDGLRKAKAAVNEKFQEVTVHLRHYGMEMREEYSAYRPEFNTKTEEQTKELHLAKEMMSHLSIVLKINGKFVSPVDTTKQLREHIAVMETEASEKDRDLYERILVNTLGDSIRRKIYYVQNWEKEMNRFMEHDNLIKFRIKWVPKTPGEGESDVMETRKLVEVLKRDSKMVNLNEISKHFQTKIKKAKRSQTADGESKYNLQEVIREVLDYRQWYEFEIYFTKKGLPEQRLHRKTYGQLSGGQRVLALITPALAALHAKYTEAREDAPKIFTLDEAFARVDDENINSMFEYIRKLDFNYIINSQALWGCYASVPSLNIYELARPDNCPSVGVASYYWNGVKKTKIEAIEGEEVVHPDGSPPTDIQDMTKSL